MTDAIIVAVLGLVGTLAGSYLANRKSAALVANHRIADLEKVHTIGQDGMSGKETI